tara:strand:+ start:2179 stop:3069 length:891 start_codon:yes stop_codon:yes gene_type:complete
MELMYNKENHDLFWNYVNERQQIWYKRFVLHQEAPWTHDKIFQSVHFTNVYPQLDRGHQYLINHVVPNFLPKDQLFRTMVYRAFNNIDSWKLIEPYITLKTFDSEKIFERLQQRKLLGHKIFTGAYMITGTKFAGSDNKLTNYAKGLLPTIVSELTKKKYASRILDAETLEETFHILHEMTGVGKFNAYILATDISYTGIKPYSLDDWANAGPGAIKAIKLIYPDARGTWLAYIQDLRDKQKEHLDKDFPYYNNQNLTLDCIEWSLCEFQKYNSKLTKAYRSKARYFTARSDNPYE